MNKDIHQPSAFDGSQVGGLRGWKYNFSAQRRRLGIGDTPFTRQRRAHVLWPWWRRGMAGELLTSLTRCGLEPLISKIVQSHSWVR
jgi:hypothetical protein